MVCCELQISLAGIQTLKQRSSDLRSRLGRFLPQLAAANAAVKERVATEGIASVDIEAVDEEEQHIEMVSCRMGRGRWSTSRMLKCPVVHPA